MSPVSGCLNLKHNGGRGCQLSPLHQRSTNKWRHLFHVLHSVFVFRNPSVRCTGTRNFLPSQVLCRRAPVSPVAASRGRWCTPLFHLAHPQPGLHEIVKAVGGVVDPLTLSGGRECPPHPPSPQPPVPGAGAGPRRGAPAGHRPGGGGGARATAGSPAGGGGGRRHPRGARRRRLLLRTGPVPALRGCRRIEWRPFGMPGGGGGGGGGGKWGCAVQRNLVAMCVGQTHMGSARRVTAVFRRASILPPRPLAPVAWDRPASNLIFESPGPGHGDACLIGSLDYFFSRFFICNSHITFFPT